MSLNRSTVDSVVSSDNLSLTLFYLSNFVHRILCDINTFSLRSELDDFSQFGSVVHGSFDDHKTVEKIDWKSMWSTDAILGANGR